MTYTHTDSVDYYREPVRNITSTAGTKNYCKELKRPKTARMRATQRVRIAKDVLAQLNAGTILAKRGDYVTWSDADFTKVLRKSEANEKIVLPDVVSACAIGSVFTAALDRYDAMRIKDLASPGYAEIEDHDMLMYLQPWFEEDELRLMECIFEDNYPSYRMDHEIVEAFKEKAIKQSRSKTQSTAEKILRAMMRNIVKNNGEFVL